MLKIYFKPRPRLKKLIVDLDFSTLAIKGRQSQGNLFSRYPIHKIVVKSRGTSTLAGQNIWYDNDVRRLNNDEHGVLLGEFKGDDKIVVWTAKHQYYITNFDLMQHFPDDTIRVEKYAANRVYSVCYFDREQNFYYLKRFELELTDKIQYFLGEDASCDLITYCGSAGAKLEVTYKGAHATRPADMIEVDEFIATKSHRAKGKRISTYEISTLTFVEAEIQEPEAVDIDSVDLPIDANFGAVDPGQSVVKEDQDDVLDTQQLGLF